MTKENIGIFAGDHEGSSLIEWFSVDLDEAKNLPFVLEVIDERLKKDKILRGGYLHYASGDTIRRDTEFERDDLYDIDADELEGETGVPPFTEAEDSNYRSFVGSVLKGYDESYGGISPAYVKELRAAVVEALADKVKKEEANHGIAPGTAVYLLKPDSRRAELIPVAFDPSRHDARKVLEAALVSSKPLAALELYPMPPSKSNSEPKFWGHFKAIPSSKVHFTGDTHRDIKLKASVYEAWVKLFEEE